MLNIKSNEKLPFEDNYFDVVMSLAVIEHVESMDLFLSEIKRVVKDDGIIIISSDCYSWRILQLFKKYNSMQPIDRTLTFSQFSKLFKSNGFKIKHFDFFNYPARGNILLFYLFKNRFNKIDTEKYGYREIIDKIILEKQAPVKKIKNMYYDENIFLLEKN